MNDKFNKNAKVEKFTTMLGIAVRLIVIDPLNNQNLFPNIQVLAFSAMLCIHFDCQIMSLIFYCVSAY